MATNKENTKPSNSSVASVRLTVPKTLKMFVNGDFIRSERGRVLSMKDAKGQWVAHYPWATRKDFRNAVVVARNAQASWENRSAFNRGQILFRIAEMLEDRRALLEKDLISVLGWSEKEAKEELNCAIDRVFWYAGWTDKYQQVVSSVNPVSSPYFNFSFPEAVGVVTLLSSKESPLLGLLSTLLPVLLSGNTCIVVSEDNAPSIAVSLCEVFATSDVPAGVINVLTGKRDELMEHIANHMDVNAVVCVGGDANHIQKLQHDAANSVKRIQIWEDHSKENWRKEDKQSLYKITPFIETKTAWHPKGF